MRKTVFGGKMASFFAGLRLTSQSQHTSHQMTKFTSENADIDSASGLISTGE